jgi:hypothetical protein
MSYFPGLGATWDVYCTGVCEAECAQACKPGTMTYDATRCTACKSLFKKQIDVAKAAMLITGARTAAPGVAIAPPSMPSWVLPVGIGVGALALVFVFMR